MPIFELTSETSVTMDGVCVGAPIDCMVNMPEHASEVQAALVRYVHRLRDEAAAAVAQVKEQATTQEPA